MRWQFIRTAIVHLDDAAIPCFVAIDSDESMHGEIYVSTDGVHLGIARMGHPVERFFKTKYLNDSTRTCAAQLIKDATAAPSREVLT